LSNVCELAVHAARTALAVRARNLQQLAGEVRAEEVEGIHQMRVASRRLRAALREFDAVTGPEATPFGAQVRAITSGLGRARELDVMMGMLLGQRAKAPEPLRPAITFTLRQLRRFRRDEAHACARAADAVSSGDFTLSLRLLLDDLTPTAYCHLVYVRERLLKREQSLRKQFRRWEVSDNEPALHRVRIGFKKLRYACEVHADHYGDDMTAYLASLKTVQQLLGDWNDCRVLRDEITAAADRAPGGTRRVMPALARAWDKRAARHLERFHRKAPAFFDKKHVRRARALFASLEVTCTCGISEEP